MLKENVCNGYNDIYVYIVSFIGIVCGISVIISKNPVVSVLYLIGLFLSISCYLIMIGLNFIGLSYLLVYIGAVSILFLFILMLINVRVSELLTDNTNSIPLAILVGIIFSSIFNDLLPYTLKHFTSLVNFLAPHATHNDNLIMWLGGSDAMQSNARETIYYTRYDMWESSLWESFHITSLGNIIYSSYSMWLIITSLILLLSMVGAIVITIKPKN